jgi:MFS family permease
MGLLTLVEDRPTPKAVYNWRVYTAACVASWAACMIGYDSAFIGTTLALPSFVSEFRFAEMDPAELNLTKANIVSVYQAGAFFGAFGAYASSYYIGRKKSLILWVLIVSFHRGDFMWRAYTDILFLSVHLGRRHDAWCERRSRSRSYYWGTGPCWTRCWRLQ